MGTNRNKQPSDRRILAAAAKALLALSVTTALLLGFSLGPVEGLSLACALLGAMVGLAFHLSVRKAPQEDSPKEPTHAEEPAPSTEPAPTKGSDPADLAASASVPSESSAAGTEPADKQEDAAATSNAISAEVTSVEDASAEASRENDRARPTSASPDDAPKDGTPPSPTFSFQELEAELLRTETPFALLEDFVNGVNERADAPSDGDVPSALELFLARRLTEAGLFDKGDDQNPPLDVVLLRHSRLLFLRTRKHALPYGSYLRIVRLEAALNAAKLTNSYYGDGANIREEDPYRFAQRFESSLCAQAPAIDNANWSYLAMPWQTAYGPSDQGEWSVRQSIAEAFEGAQLPYRLDTSFRVNVAEGNVAVEFITTSPRAFPLSMYVDGLGVIPSSAHARRHMAAHYAARVGILLAAHAFNAASHIHSVWISALDQTPSRRRCLFSAHFSRRAFARLRLDAIRNPIDALSSLGASIDYGDDAKLRPVAPLFYLEDERFCPVKRHDLWQMSERTLPVSAALSLGASRVSGLVIHEELPRMIAADRMIAGLEPSSNRHATEHAVRSTLDVAHLTSDTSVWDAAERIAQKLIAGTLSTDEPDVLRDEMINGDDLSKAVDAAEQLLSEQKVDEALGRLERALRPIDATNRFRDTSAIVYRCFGSFAERVLYNRLNTKDDRSVELVPDSYAMAHLLSSSILVAGPQTSATGLERALEHARRALEVAPLSASAHMAVAACLEQQGDVEAAVAQICSLLEHAHDAQTIGFAYYRMAALQWRLGHWDGCQACYAAASNAMPSLIPVIVTEWQFLAEYGDRQATTVDAEDVLRILKKRNIPVAPTEQTAYYLYDCAAASVDAEVFPVARDLMHAIESLTHDDVLHAIRNSLEREPDF